MTSTELVSVWQAHLYRLTHARRERSCFLRRFPPTVFLKSGRFSPAWCPQLWFAIRPGAFACFNRVVISEELLDSPEERRAYLLAHELGHVERGHSFKAAVAAMVWFATVLYLLSLIVYGRPVHGQVIAVAAFALHSVAAFGLGVWVGGQRAEYEADEVAASIIGRKAVAEGIVWMAETSGRGITSSRRARLRRLGFAF